MHLLYITQCIVGKTEFDFLTF